MTHRLVHRPTRITEPVPPAEPTTVSAPPAMTDGQVGGAALHTLLPVLGALSSVTMIVVLRNSNPLYLVMGAVLLVVALVGGLGFALSSRGQAARSRRTQRELYLDYLERFRAEMRERTRAVRDRANEVDPDPAALPELIRDPGRLWERRRAHEDFLRVRVGVGDVPWFTLTVPPAENPVRPHDPIMLAETEAVAEHYATVLGMPVAVGLDGAGEVAVIGDRAGVLDCARAMVLQLAALHSPDDLLLAAVFDSSVAADWQGFDLLPHAVDPKLRDAGVPARRVAGSMADLARVMGGELADRAQTAAAAKRTVGNLSAAPIPRLVVFCDDWGHVASSLPIPDADLDLPDLQITTVHLLSDRLHEPSDVRVRITLDRPVGAARTATVADSRPVGEEKRVPEPQSVTLDRPSPELFAAVARSLAPLRLSLSAAEETESTAGIGITSLLGIEQVGEVGPALWEQKRSSRDFLRVPIGVDDYGAPVLLDLKESAELGMGPHGICIGATGSGKSEMLRTLVLALALSHPPEDLSMVLVDYKGGAAFAPFAGLPHVAGIIDNLADDPQLTARARASIAGEVVRRQEQLRDAGSVPSISHYRELRAERARTGGPALPPMPHLFVVIDEFGELLTAEPDFVELLIQIGRIGRSIGVHLLLSSQRIESGRLRGLDTYLSYRIGLRTFSEAESNVVLDTKDAFYLPAIPGYGYLKVDTTVYRRFRSGYVSGPATGTDEPVDLDDDRAEPMLLPTFNTLQSEHAGAGDEPGELELTAPTVGRPLVEECVDRLQTGADRQVSPVWLPPLPDRLPLARVISDELAGARQPGLRVPIGLIDNPTRQTQEPWLLDLSRAGGHVAVIGAPGTGRSTFLRTVAAGLALTHTPRQVSIYGMDLTGGGLRRIEGFPHVGGVATRAHPDRLLRLLEELRGMLAARERTFRDRGIDSLAVLRARHAAGQVPELVAAEVVLLVDGVSLLRTEFDELEEQLFELLQRGGSFGLHVVLGLTRWNDIRMTQQPMIGTRIELRLNDPADSTVSRKLNAVLRADQPGRVLTDDSLFGQVALPVLDDVPDDDLGTALEELARRSAESWQGPAAAPIRLLPTDLDPALLPDAMDEPDAVPFGLRQDTMEPALLELDGGDQHLLVFGDTGSGKTTVLRTLVRGLLERYTADELVIAVMDLRGDVAAEVPDAYLGGHATTAGLARGLSTAIATELQGRMTPAGGEGGTRPGVGSGPRIVVVADDFDILASGGNDPLGPLLPFLPSARDLRLHVLLTRPVAGVGRAMYDVGLQTLRDTGGSLLVLSGERGEGQIVPGVYAEQMVPGRGQLVRRGEPRRIVQVAHARAAAAGEDDGPVDGREGAHGAS
ncbi:S-DNA-T family DNA segregation ATPase FtsK/SpoIIIE [Friedmanniella endophytica]|uniref:S-DNA-T family DNA segregation ATPase FtsK/SpoIIIE n=1 Tax=Microlunatus kandeliicorticis TaxID=1759536 RepID=A0A7W3IQZ9_9ACTN|nr:type VII secretion protein EccCa [Microlunatus kandeliicorticis]MBA8793637.1 S-DNA-T family DNA segregation ATPase FtsK/SpoIIIE [Microlunatus kandeliicorticis]